MNVLYILYTSLFSGAFPVYVVHCFDIDLLSSVQSISLVFLKLFYIYIFILFRVLTNQKNMEREPSALYV
uniref:Uncharacterized protein n=1 Tax=Panstrongylus lignarius TaxID=156445 RepID=A0A224XUG5_9HEMI